MTLDDLILEVTNIIQDSAFNEETIETYLNEALVRIAAGVQVPGELHITAPLPDLYTEGTLDLVDTARVISLPTDYQRDLFNIYSSTGNNEIPVFESLHKFLNRYPVLETGSNVEACVVRGTSLIYHPAATETITFAYYKTPTTMTSGTDEPEGIPAHLQRRLLIGYVCREIFNRIEDGIEGQKVNTNFYDAEFFEGVVELDRYLGDDGLPEFVTDDTDYIL